MAPSEYTEARLADMLALRGQGSVPGGRPARVHDRDSDGETLTILDDMRAFETGVLFHCYTGDVACMQAITARGGYISIQAS